MSLFEIIKRGDGMKIFKWSGLVLFAILPKEKWIRLFLLVALIVLGISFFIEYQRIDELLNQGVNLYEN